MVEKKTTSLKPATSAKAAPKAGASTKVEPTVTVAQDNPAMTGNDGQPKVGKGDFLDRVVARSGMKKSDVKTAMDAVFEEMSVALGSGEVLALHPLGKMRVARTESKEDGEMMVIKLRRKDNLPKADGERDKNRKEGLAPTNEDR